MGFFLMLLLFSFTLPFFHTSQSIIPVFESCIFKDKKKGLSSILQHQAHASGAQQGPRSSVQRWYSSHWGGGSTAATSLPCESRRTCDEHRIGAERLPSLVQKTQHNFCPTRVPPSWNQVTMLWGSQVATCRSHVQVSRQQPSQRSQPVPTSTSRCMREGRWF